MLLLPFVENSFKHGVGKQRSNAWIEIDLTVQSNNIIFLVKNSQSNSDSAKKKNTSSGIGLTNVKKRLSLIYPNKYNLNIENQDKVYHVKLKLNAAI